MVSGLQIKFFIYDSLGYKVGGYSGADNDDVITANLNANETYTIRITQYSNYGSYQVDISM